MSGSTVTAICSEHGPNAIQLAARGVLVLSCGCRWTVGRNEDPKPAPRR